MIEFADIVRKYGWERVDRMPMIQQPPRRKQSSNKKVAHFYGAEINPLFVK